MKTNVLLLGLLSLVTACSSTETSIPTSSSSSSSSGAGSTSSGATSGSTSSTTSSGSSEPCDSKPHCSSDNTGVSTCTSEDGIPVTTTDKCNVGMCKNGACGACTKASECNTAFICGCKDGTNVGVTETGTCGSGQCICSWGSCTQSTSVCPGKCADHGGWSAK